MKLLSTGEAAAALKITIGRVQQLIWEGRLPAQMIGNRYVVNESDLKLVAGIKRGRPPKQTSKKGASPDGQVKIKSSKKGSKR